MLLGKLIQEYLLDGGMIRFALVALTPFLFCITMFAAMCVVGSVVSRRMMVYAVRLIRPQFQIIGPVNQVSQKSMYFSGVPPKRTTGELSHVTVQLPVYKVRLAVSSTASLTTCRSLWKR